MNSRDHDSMQSMLGEIDKLDEKIFKAKTHCSAMKNSIIADRVREFEARRSVLMDKLDNHLSTWMEKLPEVKHEDNSETVLSGQ